MSRRRVISSSSPLGLLASSPPSSSPSFPMRVVIFHLRPMCFVLVISASLAFVLVPPRVLVWFLIASLPVPSTSWAGRSLLACPFVAALVSCLVPSRAPRLACPTVDRSRRRRLCPCPFASARVSSCPVRCLSPFFDKRGRGGGRLAICLLVPRFVLGCGFPVVRACGRAGCCLLASDDGGCRAMSAGVVFGLWCPCLYI